MTAVEPSADDAFPSAVDRQDGVEVPSVEAEPILIQLLHVSHCANLDELLRRVEHCIARLRVNAVIEDLEGFYPSPTLIVDGTDVTGHPIGSDPSCRLDIPTEDQIMAAISRWMRKGRAGSSAP